MHETLQKLCLGTSMFLSVANVNPIFAQSKNSDRTSTKRPNIIVFLVDDLGWNDTSLPMSGEKTKYNQRYKTPNLERMAQQGVMLTNAHAQAISVASRASLLTGQNFITNAVTGDYEYTTNPFNTLQVEPGTVLDRRFTLPAVLKMAGYKTIHCGKFHLSEYKSHVPTPTDAGFDVNIAGSIFGQPGSYRSEDDYTRANMVKSYGYNPMVGLEKYYKSGKHLTDALTEVAIDEMHKAVDEDKPFFLYMAHFAVHTPIQPHPEHMHLYPLDECENREEAEYGSLISGVDASLGTFMDELDKMGIADNTFLIFMSDNGGRVLWRGKKSMYGDYEFNYPLRSGKASLYEGGIRVPAVVRWPGKIKGGRVSDIPMMIEDIYATALGVAQTEAPAHYRVEGVNWLPYFTEGKASKEDLHRSMFFNAPYRFEGLHKSYNGPDFVGGGVTPSTAIIKDHWKLIYTHANEDFQLYNLKDDLSEKHDLIHKENKKAYQLAKELDEFLRANNGLSTRRVQEGRNTLRPLDAFNKLFK